MPPELLRFSGESCQDFLEKKIPILILLTELQAEDISFKNLNLFDINTKNF